MASQSFVQLVSLACHDLRTPLATAAGFARTLERLDELAHPSDRYVRMIGAATDQLADLLDLLSVLTRIESGRYEPQLRTISTRALADDAAGQLDEGRASVEGEGIDVRADPEWAPKCLSGLAEAARRHGGLEHITLRVDGGVVSVGPIVAEAGPIAVGDDPKDFAAAVGARVLAATGVELELGDDALRVRFGEG
ncbi:MAG TPA: histidine kinase dimerization/phospho-acceptor domain-containing protein [Gaiellaceae bacterium]|nr:histidine kinase dimerization/phospho-acceptor domain-containing protein [Gaiellaceae bacterium]